jgi:predicted nucleotidyltransferase
VYTVEERDRVRDTILEMARADPRIVAAAAVGSLARGGGDRWSDLDLSFGVAAGSTVAEVLEAWSGELDRRLGAAHLFDLPLLSTVYRVFLLPGGLQVDLSFTPGAEFGAHGPRFSLLFGTTVERAPTLPPPARHRLGLAVHHALRARLCIERGRPWQADYWIGAVRHEALSLACTRLGLPASYGRGFDDLPAEVTARAEDSLVRSSRRDELLRALAVAVDLLIRESAAAPDLAARVEPLLHHLVSASWPDGD